MAKKRSPKRTSESKTAEQLRRVVAELLPRLDAVLAASDLRRATTLDCQAGPASEEMLKIEPDAVLLQLRMGLVPIKSDALLVLS